MNIRILPLLALLLFVLPGCQPSAPKADAGSDAKPAQEQAKPETPQIDQEKLERDKAQAQKLIVGGQVLPPVVDVSFNAESVNERLTMEDADRSFMFSQTAVRLCYKNILGYHPDAKGTVTATIRHDESGIKIESFSNSIDVDGFESCIREALSHWRLPDGAQMSFSLDFSSKPGPTLEEFRELHGHGHDHAEGHEHGEEHEHGDAEAAVPEQAPAAAE